MKAIETQFNEKETIAHADSHQMKTLESPMLVSPYLVGNIVHKDAAQTAVLAEAKARLDAQQIKLLQQRVEIEIL